MLLMERARLWPKVAPIGPGSLGEGKPKEEEVEVGRETLRKRKVQRMPEDMGWDQGTCLYWSGPSWCWALTPAGRPSALIEPDRSVSMQPHHSGCFQGSWHGRTILFVEDQPLLGRHLHRRELSTGLFGGRLQTMSPDTKNATSTNYRLCCWNDHAIATFYQYVRVLAMFAFDRESTCQWITCSSTIGATGHCRISTSAFRARPVL